MALGRVQVRIEPWAAAPQGLQLLPHESTLSSARQLPLQLWKPGLQVIPQIPKALQVGVPPVWPGHVRQPAPQEVGELARH